VSLCHCVNAPVEVRIHLLILLHFFGPFDSVVLIGCTTSVSGGVTQCWYRCNLWMSL